MQHQTRQDEKPEQGSNDGSQEYHAHNGETDKKSPSDSNTKEPGPLPGSTESTTQRTNNELYELLTQVRRLVQTETAYISDLVSEITYQLRDDRSHARDYDIRYSDERSWDNDSQSDYKYEKYSDDDDSTNDYDSDGYSMERSRGRKYLPVTSKGQPSARSGHRGRFPIAVAAPKN